MDAGDESTDVGHTPLVEGMQQHLSVTIKLLNKKRSIPLSVWADESTSTLHDRIEVASGETDFRLTLGGRRLASSSQTVTEAGLRDKCTILLARNKGCHRRARGRRTSGILRMAKLKASTIEERQSFLFAAIDQGNLVHLSHALRSGANADYQSAAAPYYGNTPLMLAVVKDWAQAVEVLLDHGANPNLAANGGYTAAHRACYWGHEALAKLLIDRGADVSGVRNHSGHTPLQMLDGINPAHLQHAMTGATHMVKGKVSVVWEIERLKEKLAEYDASARIGTKEERSPKAQRIRTLGDGTEEPTRVTIEASSEEESDTGEEEEEEEEARRSGEGSAEIVQDVSSAMQGDTDIMNLGAEGTEETKKREEERGEETEEEKQRANAFFSRAFAARKVATRTLAKERLAQSGVYANQGVTKGRMGEWVAEHQKMFAEEQSSMQQGQGADTSADPPAPLSR
jgi:hypothetical protein